MTTTPIPSTTEIQLQRFDHFSPEDMEHVVNSADISHMQLGNGLFSGRAIRVLADGKVFDSGIYSQAILARGDMPSERICFAFVLPAQTGGVIQGHPLDVAMPLLFSEGAELNARFEPGTRWVGFQVARQEIEAYGIGFPDNQAGRVAHVSGFRKYLSKEIGSMLKDFTRLAETRIGSEDARFAEERVEHLLSVIVHGLSPDPTEPFFPVTRGHRRLVSIAREYIDANMADTVRIRDLCASLGVSYTTLERAFAGVLGVTPCRYLSVARLSRTRQLLLDGNRDSIRITDIAFACGFVELGRFSRDYRLRFGESPSQTLR